MIQLILFLLGPFHLWPAPVVIDESQGMKFKAEPLVTNLHIPWGFEFLDKSKMIINEKNGQISLFNFDTKKVTRLTGGPKVHEIGQGGLMDVHKHPDYPKKPWIYISYTEEVQGKDTTSLARFQIKGNNIVFLEKLFQANAFSDTTRHFGSRITFDNQGFLYLSIGERGVRNNAQDLTNHAGSIVRLHEDGKVPKDNPFVGQKNKKPEIWSFGHRNPQGLVYDKRSANLWVIEHGPLGGDELNLVLKGKNYGWPIISYGKEYWGPVAVGESTHKQGMEQPVHYYVPSIAPCGLEVYNGQSFPGWKGSLFTGALKLTHLNRITLKDKSFHKEERLLEGLKQRIRSVKQGPDDLLYLSTDSGNIYRISPITPENNKAS